MRAFALSLGLCVFMLVHHPSNGAGPPPSWAARKVVMRAVEAHGGKKHLQKLSSVRTLRREEVIDNNSGKRLLTVEADIYMVLPNQCRVMRLQEYTDGARGQLGHVFDGNKGWMIADGVVQELSAKALDQIQTSRDHYQRVCLLYPLLEDKGVSLSVSGESVVEKDVCIGVHVSGRDVAPLTLYFSVTTGLLRKVRSERTNYAGKTSTVESVYTEFKKASGLVYPSKGYQVLPSARLYYQVTRLELSPKIDKSTFARPKGE